MKTVLIAAPHPDDAEIICAGTLALLHKAGWEVHIATLSKGDKGSATHTRDEITRIRNAEAINAASVINGTYHCLGFASDGQVWGCRCHLVSGGDHSLSSTFDRVLVAIGRKPNSAAIGLENTAVEVDTRGFVQVDEQRRTADQRIFAVGDVVGGMMLAHKAMHEGKVAAEVIAGKPAAFDVQAIPAVVYTDPQIAWAGLQENQAQKDRDIVVARFPWAASGRAVTMGAPEGLTKMIFEPETDYELNGVYGNCVFSNGMVADNDGALTIFYGAADRICAAAVTTIDEMIAAAKA